MHSIFFHPPTTATGIRGVRSNGPVVLGAVLLGCALLAGCAGTRSRVGAGPTSGDPPAGSVLAPGPAVGQEATPERVAADAGGPLHPVSPPSPEVRTLARVRLAATGDVLPHGAVKDAAAAHAGPGPRDGFGWLWAPIADLLAAPDLTFANLETPVAPRSGGATRSFVFNAPPAMVKALRGAGVRVVSVANNHAFDQGRAGFEETLTEVQAAGVAAVGGGEAGRESGPRVLEVNGIRIAFLGYASFFNQDGNDCPPAARRGGKACLKASLLDPRRAVAEVEAAARVADAVVVSLHWGVEYEGQPRAADVELAHRLADAGALVILGHHPHVLQPVELYSRADGRTALIAYSLGNFVSNQSRNYVHGATPESVAATRDGVLLRAQLARRDYGRGVIRTELAGVDWLPLWTENDTADPERRTRGAKTSIRVVSLDRALAEVRAELASFPDPVPPGGRGRYVKLRQREELYRSRKAAIAAVLGEDLEGTAPAAPTLGADAGSVTPVPVPGPR